MMKKQILISTFLGALLVTGAAQAASWQESLSSAANELTKESSTQGGLSASSLTSLLGNSSQSLSAGTMNNAAGILEYCAKQKLASVTDAQNVKTRCWVNWVWILRSKKRTPTIWTAFRACLTRKTVSSLT
jgi:hypothetical protein